MNEKYLDRMIEIKAIGHPILFTGPTGAHKLSAAKAFTHKLLGKENHPDQYIYHPEGKIGLHSIDSMRGFCEEVYLAPYSADWKVFIIHDADRMLPTSSNALLKTLEEPARQSLIILTTDHPENILPTIFSRMCTLYFHADPIPEPANPILIDLLYQNPDYPTLLNLIKSLTAEIEDSQVDEPTDTQELTAAQKSHFNKEFEGMCRMSKNAHVRKLFIDILAWYRDLHLLRANGDPSHLIHKDHKDKLISTLERGEPLALPIVTKAIQEANLAYERSTSLSHCLESLHLKLKLSVN